MRETTKRHLALAASVCSLVLVAAGCGSGGSSTPPPPTFAISGAVSGAGTSAVTITLSGDASRTTTTDTSGNYSFTGLAGGAYTLTPSLAGYTFTPSSLAVTVNGADVTGRNFTALPAHSISGTVSGAGTSAVTVTLSGAGSAPTTTDTGGNYTFSGLADGSYTVTPSAPGYAFTPSSRSATVAGADVTGLDFTAALQAIYTISGTVSGSVSSGVTVTLSGAASATTTTDGSGNYSFTGLTNGSYTLTPSYTQTSFTPPSITVTLTGADLTGQNFTSGPAPTYTLSGTVTGAWGEDVTVSLGGAATATTTTSSSGAYSFTGLYAGTYTVTPSLAGYTYSPAGPTVTVGRANVTQDFTASSALPSYSISGTLDYAGTKTGQIYVGAVSSSCTGCSPTAGTSISGPGSFTVRGLPPGSYQIVAWRDAIGQGARNATDPAGSTGTLTITSADLTGIALTLTDPVPPSPQTPTGLVIYPADGGAVVFWNEVRDANGVEAATAYKIYWGTDANASNQTPITVTARDDAVYIQGNVADGSTCYYKISSFVGASESAVSAVSAPVTIGAVAGPNVLTGSVTFPGTATGPLYVGAFDMSTGTMRAAKIASPASPQVYTVTGIPSGNYFVFAIIDMNGNGVIDTGDLSNTRGAGGQVVPINVATTQNVTLSNANASVSIATSHQIQQGVTGSDYYGIQSRVTGQVRLPVAVTLYSGPNVAVPADIARSWDFELWSGLGSTRPAVGDICRFKIWYSDGTSELKSGTVSAVLDSFAETLSVTPTPSANIPTFNWAAPASPPASYTYRLSLYGPGASWWYPQDNGMPSTQTSVQYNVDGSANPPSLAAGTTYDWSVIVEDQGGNQASVRTTYTP